MVVNNGCSVCVKNNRKRKKYDVGEGSIRQTQNFI
jgi:hypothetical protein